MFGSELQSKVLDSVRRLHVPERTDELLSTLREASDTSQGYLRDIAGSVRDGSLRASRSMREMVKDRPAESIVLVAGAAFAMGWLVRHVRDRVTSTRTARPARARTRK
jgi:hypothetical protein